MTPPHNTDSDWVHMMDLVWTSHTDKQQPHRQHLSWKRIAVACFGCCFTADLTSTYMFRAIFDCYGNTYIYIYTHTHCIIIYINIYIYIYIHVLYSGKNRMVVTYRAETSTRHHSGRNADLTSNVIPSCASLRTAESFSLMSGFDFAEVAVHEDAGFSISTTEGVTLQLSSLCTK